MKYSIFLLAAPALAMPEWHPPTPDHLRTWAPAGPGDVRAPCPMLNTLANHGFLPHDGHNITLEITQDALYTALNINQSLSSFLFDFAIRTNPGYPNVTNFFDLDHLSRHNILEHDASLSRQDFYYGDNHDFNQTIFDQTRSYWTAPIVDVKMAAAARQARVETSNATNPTFSLSALGDAFGIGETAAYIMILGDYVSGTAKRRILEYFFEHEKLPTELGWCKPETLITNEVLNNMMDRVVNATVVPSKFRKRMIEIGSPHIGRMDISA